MSLYRSERDADRHRIEALEAKLAEREREVAEREAHIAQLHEELDAAKYPPRPPQPGAMNARTGGSLAARFLTGAMLLGAGIGFLRMRAVSHSTCHYADRSHYQVFPFPESQEAPPLAPATDMTFADPGVVVVVPEVVQEPRPYEVQLQQVQQVGPLDEVALRRELEVKVAERKATLDELKTLKAICAHQQDDACVQRAQKLAQKR